MEGGGGYKVERRREPKGGQCWAVALQEVNWILMNVGDHDQELELM